MAEIMNNMPRRYPRTFSMIYKFFSPLHLMISPECKHIYNVAKKEALKSKILNPSMINKNDPVIPIAEE